MTNEMVLERTSNLVMPSHYVELDRDEMSYVDGGGLSVTVASLIIDGLILAIGIGFAALGLKGTIKALSWLGKNAIKKTKKKLIGLISGCLGSVMQAVVGFTVPAVLSIAGYVCECFMMGSLGGAIAKGLDILDGKEDGFIF